jgi:hypothetical protein
VAEERQRNPHRHACCSPSAWRKKGRLGFFGWRRKKAKEATTDGEVTVPMGLFIAQGEEDESIAVRQYGFYPWI